MVLGLGALLMEPCLAQPARPMTGPPNPPNSAPVAAPDLSVAPYAMNYTDEAAQALGVHNGRLDAFSIKPSSKDSLLPTLRGGVDKGGATVQLRWKTD
jgi:hypothetical protein